MLKSEKEHYLLFRSLQAFQTRQATDLKQAQRLDSTNRALF